MHERLIFNELSYGMLLSEKEENFPSAVSKIYIHILNSLVYFNCTID